MDEKKDYRKRIWNEKQKLQESEIFISTRYLQLLKSIAKEITDGTFDNVTINWKPEAEYMGWCDGTCIEINISNIVTQSFLTKEIKNDSIVGVLGHECGHFNFTNFKLFEKFLEGILEGIWYPRPPSASCELETVCLQQIKEYFDKKDKTALLLIRECSRLIWNLLEDIYIEDRMCRKYPGSICRGILQNRSRNGEWLPSLREQVNMGYSELSIMTNLIAQYALSGTINNWDGYQGKLSAMLEEVKPLIDGAVRAQNESARFIATNQIILKIWELLYKLIQEIERKKQECQSNHKTQEKTDDQSQKDNQHASQKAETGEQNGNDSDEDQDIPDEIQNFLSQVPKFLQNLDSGGKTIGNPTDKEWDGKWSDKNTLSKDTENSISPGNNKECQKGVMKELESTLVKNIEVEEEFMLLLLKLAEEKVAEQVQQEISRELQEQMDEIEFDPGHREVKKVVKRTLSIPEADKLKYLDYECQVKKSMRKLQTYMLPILKRQETKTDRKLWIGKQLDTKYMANPSGAIFQKKNQKGDKISAAVAVLIDISDSMSGVRIEYAKIAALCLYEFCRSAGIPITVYGHHTDGYLHKRLADETVFLHSCAEFYPDANDRYRILALHPWGSNRDGVALVYMGEKLLERPEKHKILTIISDGIPNANYYKGEKAKKDLKKIREQLMKRGVTFLAAAIGADKKAIQDIYQEAYLDISDIEKLPVMLSKQVMKYIRRY